ncbi:feruloyl esterase B precursor [Clohesyomyces aquaticus]|uniref:Carboxylic ester hydrolase n=1 Tax=Clohesyomyces aquaticus TaxID=1231657 RepID=A0A1Y1ZWL7_9PLEO|nr:feruloyl esterase B precursor [Clohesyomyces aquaticus]
MLGVSGPLNCSHAAIQSVLPQGTSVDFVQNVPSTSYFEVPPGNIPYPTSPKNLSSVCVVSVRVQAPANTSYGFGLFLPNDWNGRFLAVGNGGFAGGINWLDMSVGTRYGFATMSTDTGHNSSTTDGKWAYLQPELVNNWGHRAMHGSVVAAKQLTEAYYAKKPAYSYFHGCSTGGRQGLKEAETFPEDFDGIISGAPSWWIKHLQVWTTRLALNNLPRTAEHHIPPDLFSAIGAEVLKQCDAQDGLVDSIISNPYECNFRPEALLCPANVTNSTAARCLTGPQIGTVKKIYSSWTLSNQTFIHPHLAPGSEPGWPVWLLNSTVSDNPSQFGTEYVKYFLGLGPDWDFRTLNDGILALAQQFDPGNASVSPDLSKFHDKGGKIIGYHGLSDSLIPAASSPYYYNLVDQSMKPKGIEVEDFYRIFMVPGMGHCGGSHVSFNASWYFAGSSQAPLLGLDVHSVPGFSDAKHDVLLMLQAWVENGTAPENIIATKYTNETEHKTVLRQRPVCMYPKEAKYKGTGDIDQPDSWECKLPSEAAPVQKIPTPSPTGAASHILSGPNLMLVMLIAVVSGLCVAASL